MSLILDALNRARDGEHSVPNLATQHALEERRWTRSHVVLGVALLVAVAVIVLLLANIKTETLAGAGSPATVGTASTGTVASGIQTPKPEAQPSLVAQRMPKKRAQGMGASSFSSVDNTTSMAPSLTEPAGPDVQALYEQSTGSHRTAPVNTSDVADNATALETVPAEAQPTATKEIAGGRGAIEREQEVEIQDLIIKAQSELEDARLAEHSAPFIAELSQQKKDEIPTIYYKHHDYSNIASESRVALGTKTLQVGGRLSNGVQVDEILPDSVVLSFRGVQFRLRALNSWINL